MWREEERSRDEEEEGERKKERKKGSRGVSWREMNRTGRPDDSITRGGGLKHEAESLAQNGYLAHETHCYG